jgi:hypothetical protein
MMKPETRESINTYASERGGMTLVAVMAARYDERNGSGTGHDYLDSIDWHEGVIVPKGEPYEQSLDNLDKLMGSQLPSALRENLQMGGRELPQGTLAHAMRFDLDSLVNIALTEWWHVSSVLISKDP